MCVPPILVQINIYQRGNLDSHRSALCSLGILTKDEELNLPSSIGYLRHTRIPTNNVILLGLPSAPPNLFLNHYHQFYQQ